MKYVHLFDELQISNLNDLYHQGPTHRLRQRAHIILMSSRRFSLKEIALATDLDRDTVSLTIDSWLSKGIMGLYDAPRSGRPHRFNQKEEKLILDEIEKEPRQLKKVLSELEVQTGKKACVETIKRVAKRAKLVWKRMRTGTAKQPKPDDYESKKKKLDELYAQSQSGKIALYFQDESGFSLTPSVPYAWQPRGQTKIIPTSRSPRINVVGALRPNQDWKFTLFSGRMQASQFIKAIDQLFPSLSQETWLVLDNSPIHTADLVKQQCVIWEERGLHLFFLPPYSPELNLAEIVWRFIKYSWLPFSAYASFTQLKKILKNILENIGGKYLITFV
jgi:transposase